MRKPTKNEWVAGGIGAVVGTVVFPLFKKGVIKVVGLFSRSGDENKEMLAGPIAQQATMAAHHGHKAINQ